MGKQKRKQIPHLGDKIRFLGHDAKVVSREGDRIELKCSCCTIPYGLTLKTHINDWPYLHLAGEARQG